MARRVSQGGADGRNGAARAARGVPALLLGLALALLGAPAARAQYTNPSEPGEYRQQPHPNEDAVAISFLSGRYSSPVTCKKTDGSSLDVSLSLVIKEAPESGGGDIAKATLFGLDVPDVSYCYSLIERRVVDRRGTILVRYRSYNRTDLGISDFRRAVKAGPVTYNASEGEISERGIGTEPGDAPSRSLSFAGGDSRLVVGDVPNGSDGAKLLDRFRPVPEATKAEDVPRRFTFRFIAKDGSEFTLFAVEETQRRRR